jgi:hypothetical protein
VRQIRLWRQRTGGFIYTPTLVPLDPLQFTICDDADYPWLSQWQWYLTPGTPNPLVRCVLWESPNECRIETMHRMVMTPYHGPDERYIGHFDGNNLNNQRSNLYWKKRKSRRCSPGGGYDIVTFPSMKWPLIREERRLKRITPPDYAVIDYRIK